MQKILVTGGCGYIGSHTIVDLIENGFDVISIDDNSRSGLYALTGIEKITRKKIKNYKVDLKNFDETQAVFQENIDTLIIIKLTNVPHSYLKSVRGKSVFYREQSIWGGSILHPEAYNF